MMCALFDDQAAGDNLPANVFAEPGDGAVGIPGDVGVKLQRMAADGEAEQVRFPLQAFEAGWLIERNVGELFQGGRRNEPALVGRSADIPVRSDFRMMLRPEFVGQFTPRTLLRTGMSALRCEGLEHKLRLPELARASLAELVESSCPDHRFQFFRRRSD